MSDRTAPLPPGDLSRRPLPIAILDEGTVLYRIHDATLEPLWFGPPPTGPRNRFDDPEGAYGVCYLGLTREAAFAETFLRDVPARFISRRHVDSRAIATVALRRPLTVALLHGAGLAPMGATAAVTSGAHADSRQWSRAIWSHPDAVDGIQYRCRHDNGELALAVFDRARDALRVDGDAGVRAAQPWFGSVLDRYRLALVD